MQEKLKQDAVFNDDLFHKTNIVGHDKSYITILKAFQNNKMPSNWLIQGTRGIGKASLAKDIAANILFYGKTGLNRSVLLQQINDGIYPDCLIIKREENEDGINSDAEIKVEQVKKINEFLMLTSGVGLYRTIIIDGADYMNNNASNALLKILEEPPLNVFFFIINHNPKLILPTINSRCIRIKLQNLKEDDFIKVIKTKNPTLELQSIKFLYNYSFGSLGMAINLMDNDIFAIIDSLVEILKDLPSLNMLKVQEFVDRILQEKSDNLFTTTLYVLYVLLARVIRNFNKLSDNFLVEQERQISLNIYLKENIGKLLPLIQDLGKKISDRTIVYLDKRTVLLGIFSQIKG